MSEGLKKLIAKLNKWRLSRNQAKESGSAELPVSVETSVEKVEQCGCEFCVSVFLELNQIINMRNELKWEYNESQKVRPNVFRNYLNMINNINKYIFELKTKIMLFDYTRNYICSEMKAGNQNIPPSPSTNKTHSNRQEIPIGHSTRELFIQMRKVSVQQNQPYSEYNNYLEHIRLISENGYSDFECNLNKSEWCEICDGPRSQYNGYT